jgi:xylan 1,4-beta-xylosidase
MSYWTYTDLFEEPGPPTKPFEGGFGLMNPQGIRKPAWFAYKYLHALQGNAIPVADGQTWAASDGQTVSAVVWDFQQPVQPVSNRSFYSKIIPNTDSAPLAVHFTHVKPGTYKLSLHRTGYRANDAYSAYADMGAPATLTPDQLTRLQTLTTDTPESTRTIKVGKDGRAAVSVPMHSNDVVLVTLTTSGGSGRR